ncbi:very short patch repair endonuclease [Bacillus glycinifermentans]|uniref:Very short patch repair endonuclease n=1 Tax=Bacillus glycinifermentans TaxID=1664069 RepID=A0A0T6BQ12_9BACI|nr:very short patch repair endonuclease [Bacillus glycinifermentans]ATH94648.1 very short patch repair endonuclease [Bacillus glycinifermentans]KRT93612.1 DNA mismatch repair protein Vsr [Bacillus glycinifermentans]MEC0486060.1 very short patch repair endonuclease [Bacillus glycinifermentans]
MTDVMSKEQRRKNMQAIKSISKLEEKVSRELWKRGVRFRKNTKTLYGKPDLSIKKYKVVIFIDSCFWHCCPLHGNVPKTNIEFWEKKLTRNKARDEEVNRYYIENGWYIKRVWEHTIKTNLDKVVDDIVEFINNAKGNSNN